MFPYKLHYFIYKDYFSCSIILLIKILLKCTYFICFNLSSFYIFSSTIRSDLIDKSYTYRSVYFYANDTSSGKLRSRHV